MNYRHSYHAGNHTEVFKHVVLIELLKHLRAKEAGFCVLDTHAGVGLYDLDSDEARKTGEANGGIGKVLSCADPLVRDYVATVKAIGPEGGRLYPGSPTIARHFLRPQDRLIACELHPKDVVSLRRNLRGDRRITVHHRDGYEAIGALVPFAERRGLVFVDPPFERPDEAEAAAEAVVAAMKKWPTGIYAIWYPVKGNEIGDFLSRAAVANRLPKAVDVRFIPHVQDGLSLAGGGLLIVNAPWTMGATVEAVCKPLLKLLSTGNGKSSVTYLTGDQ